MPVQFIERYISPKLARKYLKFDSDAFVDTDNTTKWCPHPSCQRTVKLSEVEYDSTTLHSRGRNQFFPDPLHDEDDVFEASSQAHTISNNRFVGECIKSLPLPISYSADCGGYHFFCWECGDEGHAPLGCKLWKKWEEKCSLINSGNFESSKDEDVNGLLWLTSNNRICPKCSSHVEKADGCNHVQCVQCRHDFCWICLESWKKHGSSSGDNLKCNQFPLSGSDKLASSSLDCNILSSINETDDVSREPHRFLHYYVRYKTHEISSKMEKPLLHSAKRKREILQLSLSHDLFENEYEPENEYELEKEDKKGFKTSHKMDPQNEELTSCANLDRNTVNEESMSRKSAKFYTDGVWELIKARLVLCSSYAYGYYLDQRVTSLIKKIKVESNPISIIGSTAAQNVADPGNSSRSTNPSSLTCFKVMYELMQNELEEVTETLSEMIARPFLRTPRRVIIQTLQLCRRKRQELLLGIYRGPLKQEKNSYGKMENVMDKNQAIKCNTFFQELCVRDSKQQINRKPFSQIQTKQSFCSGTLPGRIRQNSHKKRAVEDPWMVKENQIGSHAMMEVNIETHSHTLNNDVPLDKGYMQSCRRPDCEVQFWVKRPKNVDNRCYSLSSDQFCSLKCYKSFDGKVPLESKFDKCEMNVLQKVKSEAGNKISRRDVDIRRPSYNEASFHRTRERILQPMIGQSIWTKESKHRNAANEDFSINSPSHTNIDRYLYTLPRTSRSDDNLLLEDKPKSNITTTADVQDDAKLDVPTSTSIIGGEITTSLDSKSMSTDGLESKTVADSTVNSFLKSLAIKKDNYTTTKTSGNKNSMASPELSNATLSKIEGHKMDDPVSNPTSSRSTKNLCKREYAAAGGEGPISSILEFDLSFGKTSTSTRKLMQHGNDKRIIIKLLKRSRSMGEINQSNKKALLGSKASHHKKSHTHKDSKAFTNRGALRSKIPTEGRSPMKKLHIKTTHHKLKGTKSAGDNVNIDQEKSGVLTNVKSQGQTATKPRRPKFGRQKAFDMDSDSNEDELEKSRNDQQQNTDENVEAPTASKDLNEIKDVSANLDKKVAITEMNKDNVLRLNCTEGDSLPKHDNALEDKDIIKANPDSNANRTEAKDVQLQENRRSNTKKRHPGLTIKIHNSSMADDTEDIPDISPLFSETNELFATLSKEMAHSPTLHISGIAISRSPGAAPLSASTLTKTASSSNRNRSASLFVPPSTPQTGLLKRVGLNVTGATSCNTSPRSPNSNSTQFSYLTSPTATYSSTLHTPSSSPYKGLSHQQKLLFTFPDPPPNTSSEHVLATPTSKICASPSSSELSKNSSRSPSTARLLSSVLLVQDSCLSSDDFHEALFLDKKSPNRTLNKKKRKPKKKDPSTSSAIPDMSVSSSKQTTTDTNLHESLPHENIENLVEIRSERNEGLEIK